ncbi:rhomboid family intramembrane serine protease [Segetibacter sp.]|jgi:rhomboid protease GluP|uniref:rhomboid family intramembrane serine protease n=1 Tax=Segetibacter sp. TaxID=2231182 RepID=UPI002624D11A|nr:rhomboid family intramembrane serine protease [Segetibacter sp.]MCW3079951.1 rhomboid family intrarane serine protease [Segetibacter sp.]
MAFGWKTQFEKRVPAEGLNNWEIFSIVQQACKELEWEYLVVDENKFTATTPTHWTLSEEIIKISVENNEIIFRSRSESLELYEAGRNQKNIEEHLLPKFKKIKANWKSEQLQRAANTLRDETLKQLKSGNRVTGEKVTYGTKDHGMTFFLIAVNVLVFVAMAIRGVNLIEPEAKDIINWGGNVKFNVTGGEWWRLVTNIFVHIGILPLLVNLVGLYFIGLMVESILGKLKFLIAYLTVGVLASLVSIVWTAEGVAAGATGAIFGMYGVLIAFVTTPYVNKKFSPLWLAGAVAYAVFNIVVSFRGGNDNASLIGGLVAGLITGYLFYFFHFKRELARAGGSRISIEVLLLTTLIVYFYLRVHGRNDSLRFEREVMKLNQIEVKAMVQMQHLQSAQSNNDAVSVIRDSALPQWKHFQEEITKTGAYSLSSEYKRKRKLLNEYAGLRVRQTELMYKSIEEGTDKYNGEIDKVSDRIEKIIDQLGD